MEKILRIGNKIRDGLIRKAGRLTHLSGSGVVELILIIVVLIALVILFREQITSLTEMIFGDIFSKAESVF